MNECMGDIISGGGKKKNITCNKMHPAYISFSVESLNSCRVKYKNTYSEKKKSNLNQKICSLYKAAGLLRVCLHVEKNEFRNFSQRKTACLYFQGTMGTTCETGR